VVGFNGRGVFVVAAAEIRHMARHHPWLVEGVGGTAAAAVVVVWVKQVVQQYMG